MRTWVSGASLGQAVLRFGSLLAIADSPLDSRFAVLTEDDDELDEGESVSSNESDTVSLPRPECVVDETREGPEVQLARANKDRTAVASLDAMDIKVVFETRAHVMKTIPGVIRGVLRGAFRLAPAEAIAGRTAGKQELRTTWLEVVLSGPQNALVPAAPRGLTPRKKLQEHVG